MSAVIGSMPCLVINTTHHRCWQCLAQLTQNIVSSKRAPPYANSKDPCRTITHKIFSTLQISNECCDGNTSTRDKALKPCPSRLTNGLKLGGPKTGLQQASHPTPVVCTGRHASSLRGPLMFCLLQTYRNALWLTGWCSPRDDKLDYTFHAAPPISVPIYHLCFQYVPPPSGNSQ